MASIFGSTSTPALIHIPRFSSPERPPAPERDQDERPPKALTRDQERQLRFKNTNTKWESLGRMIEQQKASGTSSLLHLMRGTVDIAAALGGPSKPAPADSSHSAETRPAATRDGTRGAARGGGGGGGTRDTTGKEAHEASRAAAPKRGSPTKRKRDQNVLQDKDEVENRSGKRVARSGTAREVTSKNADAVADPEAPARENEDGAPTTMRKKRAQPRSPVLASAPVDPAPASAPTPLTTLAVQPKGRVPRAAMRKPPPPANSAAVETNANRRSPPPAAAFSPERGRAEVRASEAEVPSKSTAAKKPRAAPRRLRSPTPELEPQDKIEVDEIVADSQVSEPVAAKKRGRSTAKESVSRQKGKTRSHEDDRSELEIGIEQSTEQDNPPSSSRAKRKAGKADEDEAGGTGTALVEVVKAVKAGKKATSKAVQERETSTLKDASIRDEPPKKKTKKDTAPPTPSRAPIIPALLPLEHVHESAKPKTKTQYHVNSERLETPFSEDGKVNAFDVLVAGAKTTFSTMLADLDDDDDQGAASAEILGLYVANLRLSLLQRSAGLSEYSAMQRTLSSSRAKVKELKADLEELKAKRSKE
ncbi:hypothetical protein JCM11491_000465 [Sporobolomyces phaffii]